MSQPSWKRPDRLALACAAGAGALAAAVRIPGAVRDALWQDELASAHVLIQATPWGMLHQIARTEATPPLWYAIGWVANRFGLSPQGYRAGSVLAGALLAGGAVLVARRLMPVWASALAGVLVAFGWQFVMHGREIRSYELFALATLVFAWALLRELAVEPRSGLRGYVLALAVACGSLTNYFFLLSVVAALVWLFTDRELRLERRRIARQIAVGLIPLAVWSPILVHQYLGQRFSWIGPFTLRGVINVYWELLVRVVPASVLLPALLLLAIVGGCALLSRASCEGRLVAALCVGPVALAGLAWLAGAHVFDPRNLIATGPFAAIALAAVAARLPRVLAYPAALAAAVAIAVAAVNAEARPPTPYDRISRLLVAEGWKAADPILLFGNFDDFFAYRSPLEWYLPNRPLLTLGEPERTSTCRAIFVVTPSTRIAADLARSGVVAAHSSVDHVFVARLGVRRIPAGSPWSSAHVLAVREQSRACVRLVAEGAIVADLQR